MTDAPRLAAAHVLYQFAPQAVESKGNVAVAAARLGKNVDQPLRGVHANIAMENCPSHLKGGDQVGARPVRWPVFETKVTGRGGAVRCFSRRERPPLNRTASQDRVRKIREFFAAGGM